jgi:hypothetical protein
MWHAVTAKGDNLIQPHPVLFDKDAAMEMIRLWFNLMDVIRYVYISEAWTLERPDISEAELAKIDREGLANHPDRIEVVQIQGEDSEYGQIVAHRLIIRPRTDKPHLGPLKTEIDIPGVPIGARVQSEGRMVGLLPVRGTVQ